VKSMVFVWLILGVITLYGLIVLAMWFAQDRFIYFPDRTLRDDPGRIGLAYREVTAVAAAGVHLHGWHVPAEGARFTVLFCHGNAGNVSDRLETLRVLNELGLSVLIFDYRGYGRSEGKPSEAGLYADARAFWQHLVENEGIRPDRVIVWGRSLGGAVAAHLAAAVQPAGLVIESSFSSGLELARRFYPWLPVRLLMRPRFDAASQVARTPCPKLFMHSPDDDVVPYALGCELFERAAPPKQWLDLEGDHNGGFLESLPAYREAVQGFVDGLAGAQGDRSGIH